MDTEGLVCLKQCWGGLYGSQGFVLELRSVVLMMAGQGLGYQILLLRLSCSVWVLSRSPGHVHYHIRSCSDISLPWLQCVGCRLRPNQSEHISTLWRLHFIEVITLEICLWIEKCNNKPNDYTSQCLLTEPAAIPSMQKHLNFSTVKLILMSITGHVFNFK